MIVKCGGCGIGFEAKRKSAKFHSDNCRLQYFRKTPEARVSEVTTKVVDKGLVDMILDKTPEIKDDVEIPVKLKEVSSTAPNWQRMGFSSQDKAMLYTIALTVKNVPGAGVTWKGRYWTREDFSKGILDAVKELV